MILVLASQPYLCGKSAPACTKIRTASRAGFARDGERAAGGESGESAYDGGMSILTALLHLLRRALLVALLAGPGLGLAQVDINSADARMLAQSLDGIGLVKAEAIVAYREANGPFASVDELLKVKGIGPKTLAANRDAIVIVPELERAAAPVGLERPHARHL